MINRFKLIPIVSIVLKKDNQILLLQCAPDTPYAGAYTLVGGHVDGQETFRQAAVREAYEEVGILINPEDLTFIHISHRKRDSDQQELVWLIFMTEKWTGVPHNNEPDKHSAMEFFPLNALPMPLKPEFILPVLNDAKNSFSYSESGWLTLE